MKYRIAALVMILATIGACRTDMVHMRDDLEKAMITGKVISEEGLPLEGVEVELNKLQESRTDINGRFLFPYVRYGTYTVKFTKDGYAPEELSFTYKWKNRRENFVKMKLYSLNYLLKEVEEYLTEDNLEEAEALMAKLKTIDADDQTVRYLEAVIFYMRKMYGAAVPILEELKTRDRDNPYYRLSLIDCYQALGDSEMAARECLYLGERDPLHYAYLLKKAALIYRDELGDAAKADEILTRNEEYLK